MEKKEIHDILKQIYQNVQHEYDREPVNLKVTDESLIELRKFKLTEPTSKQGKELYALVKKHLEQYILLPKNGEVASIEQGLLLLQLLREFQVQDQQLAKEEHQKKENELNAEIEETLHKKFQQIAAEVVQMILRRMQAEKEYQELLEKQRKEKEEEEKKRLLALALAAFRELFEELENSTATSRITLSNGDKFDIKHRDIFMSQDYKNLHEKYFTNEIKKDEYISERLKIVLQHIQQHYSPEATHRDAVLVDRNTMAEMKKMMRYKKANDARQELAGVKEENVASKIETKKEIIETEETETAKVETAAAKIETATVKVEKTQAKENVGVEDSSLTENIETASTDTCDEFDDLLENLNEKSIKIISVSPQETPPVVEEIIDTVKSAVALEKKAEQIKNKKENKKEPGEENSETPQLPRPTH